MQTHPINISYVDLRYKFLKTVEGEPNSVAAGGIYAYVDTAFFQERGTGIATIGIGINLREHGALILQALGFDIQGIRLSGAALTEERGYIDRLLNPNDGLLYREYPSNNTSTNQFLVEANALLRDRAANTAYQNPANFVSDEARSAFLSTPSFANQTFALPSTDESRRLFTLVMDGYYVPRADGVVEFRDGYETTLEKWLNVTGVGARQPGLMTHDNKERIALLSLAFNSRTYGSDQRSTPWNDQGLPKLLGPKLTRALLNDDRAEAWYEIRYNSGTVARRLLEADTFGLYNPNPTEEDYKAAYRTLTRHREEILADEQCYAGNGRLATAVSWGRQLGIPVQSLADHLQPAHDALVAAYAPGATIDMLNLFVGEDQTTLYGSRRSDADRLQGTGSNDLILGESGNDTLIGRAGDDVLVGGTGNDTLEGGVGNDVYVFKPGEGDDTIHDADGQGELRLEATTLTGSDRPAIVQDGRTTWQTEVGGQKLYYRIIEGDLDQGATLEISGPALGGGTLTLADFRNGDLGITLDTTGLIELEAGTGANPIDSPDYQPQGGQTRLTEGGARLFTVYLNAAADAGDRIRLSVDNLAGALRVITGDSVRSFDNGTIELDLKPGQSAITFALWDKDPVSADQTLTLSASLLRDGADPAAAPSIDYTIELKNLQDPDTASALTGNTILGDQAPLRDADGNIIHDVWGNIIPIGDAPNRSDTIYDTPSADFIQAGGDGDRHGQHFLYRTVVRHGTRTVVRYPVA